MIIYRTFDGDNHEYFAKERVALNAADRVFEQEDQGPNGFIRVEKITLRSDLTTPALLALIFNRDPEAIADVERTYERLSS